MSDKLEIPEIVVPEGAAERGVFSKGTLRTHGFSLPDVLVQFERITPHTNKTRIFLLLTVDQARNLSHFSGPFTFESNDSLCNGNVETRTAKDIWLSPISKITQKGALYWTQTSGLVGSLEISVEQTSGQNANSLSDLNSAWFVARSNFVLQILANRTETEAAECVKHGLFQQDINFGLSGGATALILRYPDFPWSSASPRMKLRGYSVTVKEFKNPQIAKKDVDTLLLLASFASRERSISAYWRYVTEKENVQLWQFNIGKFQKRYESEEPLVPRDREQCRVFLQTALDKFLAAPMHQPLLEAAIYGLLNKPTTLELDIAHLFSAVQGALYFATQIPLNPKNRPRIADLYGRFLAIYPDIFDDLWPLTDRKSGPPLNDIRNAVVHGEAFSEQEWLALSYAGDHLRWYIERIILVALGWDIEKSSVSKRKLAFFTAHQNWKQELSQLVK